MPLDPDDPNLRMAVFGRQVEDFLNSDVGSYLVKCADADIQDGLQKLRTVDPEDPKAVRAAQNKVQVAESIMQWLGDAIQRGHAATELLKEGE